MWYASWMLAAAALLLARATAAAAAAAGASARGMRTTPPAGREDVTFNFAWRHSLVHPPPPPPPFPVPRRGCGNGNGTSPDAFPANRSGVQCNGLAQDAGATTPAACGSRCACDPACAVWQYNGGAGGEGCWRGYCDGAFANVTGWVGGTRGARPFVPPPPAPPPPGSRPATAQPGFPDSSPGWSGVDLPHDMIIGQAATQAQSGSGYSYLKRWSGWYRKHFMVPEDWEGDAITLYFEGSFRYTMVYLNGKLLRTHTCGYTSFAVRLDNNTGLIYGDARTHAHAHTEGNVLAVYTDATYGTGWWYEGGGLYRNVRLIRTAPVHFSIGATDAAVFARAPDASASAATLLVSADITNSGAAARRACVTHTLTYEGVVVGSAQASTAAAVHPGAEARAEATIAITSPKRWSIPHPHLYTLRSTLGPCQGVSGGRPTASARPRAGIGAGANAHAHPRDVSAVLAASGAGAGVVWDAVNTTVGIRSLAYTPDAGFFINEQHVKIRGFCDHNNFGAVGMAVPDRLNLFRAQMSRAVGGNGRRMSHNPPNPSTLDIYDRLGVAVMDENREYGAQPLFYSNMADLVTRDRNHASVTIWSICNEIGCADLTKGGGPVFRNVTYEHDGTRPVLANMNADLRQRNNLTASLDVQGFSHQSRRVMDTYHASFPAKPEFASECCSCNSQRGEDVGGAGSGRGGVWTKKSFNADCTSSQTNASDGVRYVAGTMVWTLFDYYGEPDGGWPHVSSTFGSFDLAGFPKPAAWWYSAWWLHDVPDASADKTFGTAGLAPVVRIVQSWEARAPPAADNTSAASPCATAPAASPGVGAGGGAPGSVGLQRFAFEGGMLRWLGGGVAGAGFNGTSTSPVGAADGDLCLDAVDKNGGPCTTVKSSGCVPLRFNPCARNSTTMHWTRTPPRMGADVATAAAAATATATRAPPGLAGYASAGPGGGCLDLWTSGAGPYVGLYACDRHASQQWSLPDANGLVHSGAANPSGRCLSNGAELGSTRTINAYTNLPSIELFVNGASVGARNLTTPRSTPVNGAQSWAEWPSVPFAPGNITAVVAGATHTVFTSGEPHRIVLSIDAPSGASGTGAAVVLDGMDAALVRATIVDEAGNMVANAVHNVTFEVVSGPGAVVGTVNGDPTCHVNNHAPHHPAYHGLVRAVVKVTDNSAAPAWVRRRLLGIDLDAGLVSRTVDPEEEGEEEEEEKGVGLVAHAPVNIVVRASAPGLPFPSAEISIPTSTSLETDGPLAVAEQTGAAGSPITF